jgi:hypothetical protein
MRSKRGQNEVKMRSKGGQIQSPIQDQYSGLNSLLLLGPNIGTLLMVKFRVSVY